MSAVVGVAYDYIVQQVTTGEQAMDEAGLKKRVGTT